VTWSGVCIGAQRLQPARRPGQASPGRLTVVLGWSPAAAPGLWRMTLDENQGLLMMTDGTPAA